MIYYLKIFFYITIILLISIFIMTYNFCICCNKKVSKLKKHKETNLHKLHEEIFNLKKENSDLKEKLKNKDNIISDSKQELKYSNNGTLNNNVDNKEEKHIDNKNFNKLPQLLIDIQHYLKNRNIELFRKSEDGRVNSSIDEDIIINILKKSIFSDKIKVPNKRAWYDIILIDKEYGEIPVNIKSTSMKSSDNVGNMAILVQAYTDYNLNFKPCNNGEASKILLNCFKKNKINNNIKKDYFFLIINKENPKEIYINSILGLTKITANSNNLPFQVNWNHNKEYNSSHINKKIINFVNTIKKSKFPWKVNFLLDMKKLNIQ